MKLLAAPRQRPSKPAPPAALKPAAALKNEAQERGAPDPAGSNPASGAGIPSKPNPDAHEAKAMEPSPPQSGLI